MSTSRVTCRKFILAAIVHLRKGNTSRDTPFAVSISRIAELVLELYTNGHVIRTINNLISDGTITLFAEEKVKYFYVKKLILTRVEKDVDLSWNYWTFDQSGKYFAHLGNPQQPHRSLSNVKIVISADGHPRKYDEYFPTVLAESPSRQVRAVLDSI